MSLRDRIEACLVHDVDRRLPLLVEGVVRGRVDPRFADALRDHPAWFRVSADAVSFAPGIETVEARTRAVDEIFEALAPAGWFSARRGERYPVCETWGGPAVFSVERGAVGVFGTPAYGVHLNGYIRTGPDRRLWVARRADTKPTFPGCLDHLVAGGQPEGLSLDENMRKECREEAGIPDPLLAALTPVHQLHYQLEDAYGFHDDRMAVYDLALPASFTPVAEDGEVAAFETWSLPAVIEALRGDAPFKTNVALAILDWLERTGALAGDPEEAWITEALAPLRVPF